MLNSRLIQYFSNPGNNNLINSVYNNYLNNIYPAFLNYPTNIEFDKFKAYIFTSLVFFISLFMMAFWIYIGLKIDKKRYDIMIWFLDIPVPYVSHLSNHCDKFLK